MAFPDSLETLIEQLSRFPGIGRRSAERAAFYILKMSQADREKLASGIIEAGKSIKPCRLCNNFSTREVCSVCANSRRQQDTLCIVEEPKDVRAIEKTGRYNGLYYVLLGALSPLEGIGPQELNLTKLTSRLKEGTIQEVIISTDPDNDGELTAQYLIEQISRFKVKIYRLAIGIPLGTQIEYIDSSTLGKALLERRQVI